MTSHTLATPRALKAIKPERTPITGDGITYTAQETLANTDTGALHPQDRRRVATTSHNNHVVLAVGSTAAILTPLQAEQAAEALKLHAIRARKQRPKKAR